MSSMLGPVVGTLQEFPQLQPIMDAGTKHYMHTTQQWVQPCGYGFFLHLAFPFSTHAGMEFEVTRWI